jgi:hypothetical protein
MTSFTAALCACRCDHDTSQNGSVDWHPPAAPPQQSEHKRDRHERGRSRLGLARTIALTWPAPHQPSQYVTNTTK